MEKTPRKTKVSRIYSPYKRTIKGHTEFVCKEKERSREGEKWGKRGGKISISIPLYA